MSRNPTDDDNVVHLPPHGRPPSTEAGRLPCMWCSTPTLIATLSQYGARCFRCYDAYCRAPKPSPAFMGDKRIGPRSWVDAFQKRNDSGERLTPAQLEMLRAAKRHDALKDGDA